jgi:HEAT repeat protein
LDDRFSELLGQLSADDDAARLAAQQIAGYGAQALPVLQEHFRQPSADVRWWIVRSAAMMPAGADATPLLLLALEDEDSSVRQCAALALQRRPDERAVPALIQTLSDPDSLVVRLAANALVAADAAAVPALIEMVEGAPSKARLEAIRALALIGDTRSIPALYNSLDGDSALMEYWANEGLERMGVGMTFFKP